MILLYFVRWKSENVSTREICDVLSSLPDANVYGVKIQGISIVIAIILRQLIEYFHF
jgi:acyl-CoA synthetase (AMP-forming)/AMP-acid ligase II